MKRLFIILSAVVVGLALIVWLKNSTMATVWLWNISRGGVWLLPLVFFSALLDSVHPCSFSILLVTIAFLFGLQFSRRRILQLGSLYIAGIFAAYLAIGLGLLQALHLFNTPHFMGKVGAALLALFGAINLLNYFFPQFPIKLRLPAMAHERLGKLIHQTSAAAAFGLGLLVGLCQFPCMGGPYLMVIGLLHDQVTYLKGVWYLLGYNLILVVPLVIVLIVAADKVLLGKVQSWRRREMGQAKLWIGVAMMIISLLILHL